MFLSCDNMAGGILGTAALNKGEKIDNMAKLARNMVPTSHPALPIRSLILTLYVLIAAH